MTPAEIEAAVEVLLTVTGEETYSDGHKDSSRTRSRAVYERTVCGKTFGGTIHTFRYRETDPESGAVTESVMKFSENGCMIERSGEIRTTMRFEPDKESQCMYGTPFGEIPMAIFTRLVAMRQVGNNFHARLRYRLTPAGADPIECAVTVKAEPAKKAGE